MPQQVKIPTRWRLHNLLVGMSGAGVVTQEQEPSPAGMWAHGEIVRLVPSMFGLETFGDDPNMRLFDTQDNQTVYNGTGNGENVPHGPGYVYQTGTTNRPMQFETGAANARHAHDTKRYRFDGRGFLGRPYAMNLNHTHGRKMFLECWIRYEVAQTASGACKVFRIWGDSNGDERYSSKTNNPSYMMGISWWNNSLRDRTDWMRLTCEIDTSSSDVLEWRGRYWVDGQLVIDHFRPEVQDYSQWPQLEWGTPVLSLIGHDPRTPESTFGDEWRWGRLTDVYLGIGPERFAITDASTFAATGAYETQEIVSWSPDEVFIRVFAGAMVDVAGKHLHFVGSGNQAQGTAHQIPAPVWEHGEIVALQPAMFGLESFGDDPNMRLFDTVDNQTVYNGVNNGDVIPTGVGYLYASKDNGGSGPRGPMTAETGAGGRHPFDAKRYRINGTSNLKQPYSLPANHSFGRKLFVEWWQKCDVDTPMATGSTKIIRAWGEFSSGNQRYLSWTNQQASPCIGHSIWTSALRPMTEWQRHSVEIDASSSDPLDWRLILSINGTAVVDVLTNPDSTSTNPPADSWGPPVIGLIGLDPRKGEAFYDEYLNGHMTDIYMSVAPNRIAITDSATYGPTQNYEVQEIISWAPNQVLIKVFGGALNGLAGKRVHFVGAGNAALGTAYTIPTP